MANLVKLVLNMKVNQLYQFDQALCQNGTLILGIDEVGRGCWAGPLVVCGVILKPEYYNEQINDSKQLSASSRAKLFHEIIENCIAYEIVELNSETVDRYGPKQTTIMGMKKIVKNLGNCQIKILIDYEHFAFRNYNITGIVHGDQVSYAIAAASIIAKHYRDHLLIAADGKYQGYGFKNHKGYGTKQHWMALKKWGPIQGFHRYSYRPIQKILDSSFYKGKDF